MAKPRILVVEDELIVGLDIQASLHHLGYVVAGVVASGDQAILKVAETRPDLVLMDIIIKGAMDGIETAGIIRQRFGVPVVYLTGHTDAPTLERAKQTEPFGYVVKPFEEREIQSSIEMALYKHRMERKLQDSETRYRTVVESSLQGIAIMQEGFIVYANPAYAQIFGYATPEEILGKPWESLVAPEDIPFLRPRSETVLRGISVPRHPGWQGLRRDGTRIWLESTANLITHGDRPAVLSCVVNITERRRLEERFRQAQKMEAIGVLAGGVAHDFNNLLTIIGGFSEMVMTNMANTDPSRPMMHEIRKASERAATLTRQLLAFSRKQILAPAVVAANTAVKDIQMMLHRLTGEDITLRLELDPAAGSIKVDPGQLAQVLYNLAVNACEAMPRGGTLTLKTENVQLRSSDPLAEEVKPGPYVAITVADTGIGIDARTRARLFEPFFTTKGPGKGTGLGLAMVYGVIKQSHGHIEVESERGKGSRFKIYLPQVAANSPVPAVPAEVPVKPGSETILLVEDEESVRNFARTALEMKGYKVLVASDGQDALKVAAEFTGVIDIIVTDVRMPKMGGRQLIDQISTVRPGVKVLYLSGFTEDTVLRRDVAEQTIAFLAKPFTSSVLTYKVREVLDHEGTPG